MRDALSARIRDTILRDRLFSAGDRIVIGLSGGPDSVTLTHLLPGVARSLGAEVVALAHLNHQLRPEAGEDEAFCRALAAEVNLPFESDRIDVRAVAARDRTSLEDAGRTVRYAFLERVAQGRQATRVAVGHTLNDQAETVLLRLFRGAGPTGLAGIYPRAGMVIRPLLDVRRAGIDAFLAAERLPFREDPTNRDLTIPRNRVRHELLPYLARHVGDGVLEVLARQATIAREDAEWLEREATERSHSLVLEEESRTTVDLDALIALPPALGRRIIRAVLQRRSGGRFVGFDHVDAVLALARPELPGSEVIDLPGQRVKQSRGRLIFEPVPPDPERAGRRRGRPREARTALNRFGG